MKHEVVISGMAGMFPEAENLTELKEKLFSKINMVTTDDRKWAKKVMDVPHPTGKLPISNAFDGLVFGMASRHAEALDHTARTSLETAFIAICDAGVNPGDIAGTNTATLAVSSVSEPEYAKSPYFFEGSSTVITGTSRSMQSNRIAFHLNTKGPSYSIHSSWVGTLHAIRYAYEKVANGTVDAAVIAITHLIYIPETSFGFNRMGRLNTDGCTKSFSDDADGYSRSEATVSFFLQRKENALRSYGTIIDISVPFSGSKDTYFTEINNGSFAPFFRDLYVKNNIDPQSVGYIEAVGNASKTVDAVELNSLSEALLPGRKEPLLVGSIKSNLGHCEGAADAMALVKALIVADGGIIPPNLHYTSPNKLVPALVSGKLKVVTEPTPLSGNIIGINCACMLGSIEHMIVKQHEKQRTIIPQIGLLPPDGLPRLFIMTGKDKEKTEATIKKIENMPVDAEFIALSQLLFKKGIKNHMYRGYTVINDVQKEQREMVIYASGQKPDPVWFVFTGMGAQWPGMGKDLMRLPVFAESMYRSRKVLEEKDIDIVNVITNEDPTAFDNILNSFVGIAAVQIALVEVLSSLNIVPDGIIGHSVGELGCAYADGCLTAEQVLLCAYGRGLFSDKRALIPGLMAAVGLGYQDIKDILPKEIDVACHNSKDNCTLSGPADLMTEFIKSLQEKNIFAREVNASNIAYHSRYIKPIGPQLLEFLRKVIPEPKLRSKKWISTSVPEHLWNTPLGQHCSAEYQTNNLLNPVLFEEASVHIPKNATLIEIAPHGLLQAILKRSFPDACHIPLGKRGEPNGLVFLCGAFGKMYNRGISLDIENLYPPIEFPVSRGTESLGTLINWQRTEYPYNFVLIKNEVGSEFIYTFAHDTTIDLENGYEYIKDFQVNGAAVIPLGVYLEYGINEVQKNKNENEKLNIIQLKNVKLRKYLDITGKCNLLSVLQGSGNWQLCIKNDEVVSAEIDFLYDHTFNENKTVEGHTVTESRIYEHFAYYGLKLGPAFRLIKSISHSMEEASAIVQWDGKLAHFLEAVLHIPIVVHEHKSKLLLVSRISHVVIDLPKFSSEESREVNVYYNKITKHLYCDGLEIKNLRISPVLKVLNKDIVFQEKQFFPFDSPVDLNNFLSVVMEIICNNLGVEKVLNKTLHVLEVGDDKNIHNQLLNSLQNTSGLNVHLKIIPEDRNISDIEKKQYKSQNVLIVVTTSSKTNSLQILDHCYDGFILIRDNLIPLGFEVIFKTKLNNHTYNLCKKVENQHGNCIFVSLLSKSWESELQYNLNTHIDKKVYLVGYVTKVSKMQYILERTTPLKNSCNLRYIFHDLKYEKFNPSDFKDHLNKGLRINILQQKKWGVMMVKDLNISSSLTQEDHDSSFKYSQLLMNEMKLKSVALPVTELSKKPGETAIVEFSGEKWGMDICGLGTIDHTNRAIKPDDILIWEKPGNWTHDEIISALLPYSIAFHIINSFDQRVLTKIIKFKKILVHNGLLPLSQAMINVGLAGGHEVFTTYKQDHEKVLIMKLFPKMPVENICLCEDISFADKLLTKTNGEYMHIILSSLPEREMMVANMCLLDKGGVFYQTSFTNPEDSQIGMYFFLKEASLHGLSFSYILKLSNEDKEIIKNNVRNALKCGIIKPIPSVTIKNNVDNVEALELMKDPSFANKRIILSASGTPVNLSSRLSCEGDEHFVIIVKEQKLWIAILEWLISRLASNIHVIVNLHKQPELIREKLSIIKSKKSSHNINILPENVLETPDKIKELICTIKGNGKLSHVFITSEEHPKRLKTIVETMSDAHIIYFTKKFENNSEDIKKGLVLVDQANLLDIDILHSLINALLKVTDKCLILNNARQLKSTLVIDDEWRAYYQHLPWSIKEVISLSHVQKSVGWKEVRTSTSMAKNFRGFCPILIISPIKAGQLDKLVKSLYYPAFQAVFPYKCSSLSELAHELFKKMPAFKSEVVNLICSDWSYSLGLQFGALLESVGMKVCIIFFQPLINWKSPELYVAVNQKITDEIMNKPLSENEIISINAGFEILKNRLQLLKDDFTSHEDMIKLQGPVLLFKTKFSSNNFLLQLEKLCANPVCAFESEEEVFLNMINSKEVINVTNSILQIHYKDAAINVPPVFSFKRYILNYRAGLLQRLSIENVKKIRAKVSQ